ncbi:MAG: glycosyltransferase family 4 protein [Phycisphaerae bacterium]|jgi:glycosyltransferase involved in cell wall biosynthesis
MRILFIAHYFQPEPNFFVGLPFAKALRDRGHQVQVLTGFPNYPGGKIYDGYKVRFLQRETLDGIPIIRVPLYPSHDRSSVGRILSYISLSLSQAAIGPFAVDKADVAYVSQGPATIGLPSVIHKVFRKIPFVYNIQDLWPDSLLSTGMFNNKLGLKMIHAWCNFIYKRAARIVAISPGVRQTLIERGISPDRIEVIYNWCDDSLIYRGNPDSNLKKQLGMQDKFNIVFAGNMGKAQAMDSVIDAAEIISRTNSNIQFVFIGSGVEVDSLKQKVKQLSLTNVVFHGRKPVSEIGPILRLADVLLVHLRDDPLFRITVPSKTQAYLAIGKPILMGVNGDAADLIKNAQAGICCEPQNPDSIASAVGHLYNMSRADLEQLGANAMNYYDNNLSFKKAVDSYIRVFEQTKK